MKLFSILASMLMLVCISAKADENVTVTEPDENQTAIVSDEANAAAVAETPIVEAPVVTHNLTYYDNLYNASYPFAAPSGKSAVDKGYKQTDAYKSARTLRMAGMIGTGVGLAGIIGGIATIASSGHDDDSDVLKKSHDGWYIAVAGTAVTIAGAIMWGIGNRRMRHARLSYTGTGVAYNF